MDFYELGALATKTLNKRFIIPLHFVSLCPPSAKKKRNDQTGIVQHNTLTYFVCSLALTTVK